MKVRDLAGNSRGLARRFAVSGHGIAATNVISVHRDLVEGRLERVLPEWRLPSTPVYIVTTSRLLPAKSRTFIDFAAKRLHVILGAAAKGAMVGPPGDAATVYALRG